jgi:hypothetical protein
MDISYTCSKSEFFTNLEEFTRNNKLKINIIKEATFSNWIDCNRPFSEDDQIITITLRNNQFNEKLKKKLSANSEIFGFYVSLSSENFKYGILLNTLDDDVWCIRIFDKMDNLEVCDLKLPFVSNLKVPDLITSKNMIEKNMIHSDLLVNKDFQNLKKIANETNIDFDYQLDLSSNIIITDNNSDEMLRSIDPIQFIIDKYFTTLYQPSVILEHFVKSSLPKMHLLRRDNSKLAKECLSNLRIDSIIQFDKRHMFDATESSNVEEFIEKWISSDIFITESEKEYRSDALKKFKLGDGKIGKTSFDKLNNYVDKLKLRDLKLQILINLELLKVLKSEKSDTSKPNTGNSLNKEKKQLTTKKYSNNLVGKKKRLIPTLLGTIIPANIDFDSDLRLDQADRPKQTLTKDELKRMIDVLFEKLCVWDAITGLDYKDLDSSWGFLSNCIIPFYDKFHHKLISDLAIKSRGPAFILKLKSQKEKKEREKKRKKKELENVHSQMERKSTNIDLSKLKLERSHSSFSSSFKQDLSRKTFNMVKSTTISFTDSSPLDSLEISRQNLSLSQDLFPSLIENDDFMKSAGGFMNSKKRKLQAPKKVTKTQKLLLPKPRREVGKKNVVHDPIQLFYNNQTIEATPKKPQNEDRLLIIQETPKLKQNGSGPLQVIKSSPIVNFNSLSKAKTLITQITETPKLERVQIRPGVFEIGSSPMKSDIPSEIKVVASHSNKILSEQSPVLQKVVTITESVSKSTNRKLNFD